jgi:hypothetical protein
VFVTVIDPTAKEVLPFLADQNFLKGIVLMYIPRWLKVAVTPLRIRLLASYAETKVLLL